MAKPPDTIRFCLSCEKDTSWEFVPVLGHSRCRECNGMSSINPKTYHLIRRIVLNNLLGDLFKNVSKNQKRISIDIIKEYIEKSTKLT